MAILFHSAIAAYGPFSGWVDDADAQSGDTLEWRFKSGKENRPIISPVTNQPVKVRFTIGNPVFQKGYFSGLHCVSEIAKQ